MKIEEIDDFDVRVKKTAPKHRASWSTYSDDGRSRPVGDGKHSVDDCQTENMTWKYLYSTTSQSLRKEPRNNSNSTAMW